MGSCARRAGKRRAHSNWRRLKEGWLKVGVNLSRSLNRETTFTLILFTHSHIRVGCIDHRAETLQYVKNKEFENRTGTET